MSKRYTWSDLLDSMFQMKVQVDKGKTDKPLLSPFIKKIQEQQLSLILKPKPSNLEVLFGYCLASIVTARQAQQEQEKQNNAEKATALDPHLASALNLMFDTLEVLAKEELAGK